MNEDTLQNYGWRDQATQNLVFFNADAQKSKTQLKATFQEGLVPSPSLHLLNFFLNKQTAINFSNTKNNVFLLSSQAKLKSKINQQKKAK